LLDRNRPRLDGTFVPQNAHMITSGVNESLSDCVLMRRARWVVPFVSGDGSGSHGNETVTGVCVPSARPARCPDVTLDVQVRGAFRLLHREPKVVSRMRVPGSPLREERMVVDVDLSETPDGDGAAGEPARRSRIEGPT